MPFNQQQIDTINSNFNQKCSNARCSACGNRGWTIQNDLVFAPRFENNNVMNNGIAFVAYICNNCSATLLFSAANLGIL